MGQGIVKRYITGKPLPPISKTFAQCTWEEIKAVVDAGKVNNYSWALGNVKGDYFIVGKKANEIRILKKTSLGSMVWSSANSTANSYYSTFNSSVGGNIAKSSRLPDTSIENNYQLLLTGVGITANESNYNNRVSNQFYSKTTGSSGGTYRNVYTITRSGGGFPPVYTYGYGYEQIAGNTNSRICRPVIII